MKDLPSFINSQLSLWPLACNNFRALKWLRFKEMSIGGLPVSAQFNPARMISSAAKTDDVSLKSRPCFLCPENRPHEQISLLFEGRKGKKYDILVNPYPIFPDHLVIAAHGHVEQTIWRRFVDILDLSKAYRDFIFFYNGPKCGASAPDHHHFQAAGRRKMPLENDIDALLDGIHGASAPEIPADSTLEYVTSLQDADLFHYKRFTRGIFVLRGHTAKSTAKLFYRLIDCAPKVEGDKEPRFNLFNFYKDGEYRAIVVFRTQHRSHHYFSTGEDHLTMSPGCVDMAGLLIVPREEDFDKLDSALAGEMLSEVTLSDEAESMIKWRLTRAQKLLNVGIMSAPVIEFEMHSDGAGSRRAVLREGKIEYDGALYDELYFEANTLSSMFAEPTFILHNVTIGRGFHWERTEDQKFAGALRIIVEGDLLTAVNVIGVEDYLVSVISSEMKSTASLEFLKAHAVISRSWVMAQLEQRSGDASNGCCGTASGNGTVAKGYGESAAGNGTVAKGYGESAAGNGTVAKGYGESAADNGTSACGVGSYGESTAGDEAAVSGEGAEKKIIKWYGRSQHTNYDVCADDHCQRYQGLTRAAGRTVRDAVDATWGEILTYDGQICDARFSKCCGGIMEKFSTCWEDRDFPYLQALPDTPGHSPLRDDSAVPTAVRSTLVGHPGLQVPQDYAPAGARAFCDTDDEAVLTQVLNSYDMETKDFYRWEVVFSRDELSDLVETNSGFGLGIIRSLEPLRRGESGRISELRIRGERGSVIIGKELQIRRILSTSHLKSSAFDVEYVDAEGNVVSSSATWTTLRLRGKGWGHGVGLCQIGAAVMASQGYDYRRILGHYYPGASL